MDKLLNQEEIDAIFSAVRGGEIAPRPDKSQRQQKVEEWNLRQAGQIDKEQVRSIGSLHEGFARALTHSLGAYLRVPFEANLVSVEQLTYRELLGRLPEVAYYATFHLTPGDNFGAMQLDLGLAFPMIDVLLGGQGSSDDRVREITEIEAQILEVVARIICKELEAAWQPLGVEFVFEGQQHTAQLQRLMPPTEKILGLSFELQLPGSRGTMNLAFSAIVSNALQRNLSKDLTYRRPTHGSDCDGALKRKLLRCPFPVTLGLADVPVNLAQLLKLRPGEVLPLRRRADQLAEIIVGGRPSLVARAVRSGNLRAAQVLEKPGS